MNLHRLLAALFLVLALGGCAQVATGQGQVPDAPYSHEMGDRVAMARAAVASSDQSAPECGETQ